MLDKVSGPQARDAIKAEDRADGAEPARSETGGADIAVLRPAGDGAQRPEADRPETKPQRKGGLGRIAGKLLLAIVQAALMVAILAGSYFIAKRMIADAPEARKRPPFKTVYTVDTVTAARADIQPRFIAYGQTAAARNVELRALVSGEIVSVNPKLRAGARIAQGEELVEIDPFEYRGALSEARANLVEANARITEAQAQIALEQSKIGAAQEQLAFAQSDLARAETLRGRGSITEQQIDARKLVVSQREQAVALSRDTITVQEARLEQLRASVDRLQWKVEQAQRNLDSTTLKAPFDGIVRSSTAEIGRAITANDVVVSLYEAGSLEVNFTLSDAQYGRLDTSEQGLVGRPVDVTWTVGGKEYVFGATIDRIGAEIASTRGGVEVIAKLTDITNGVTLRPGAFVEVSVPDVRFPGVFRIPDTALYDNDTVYVVIDGQLQARKVEIALFVGEDALVSEGLSAGDEVLTTRITEVSAGLNVRREGDEATAPGKSAPVRAASEEADEKPDASDSAGE